VDRFDSFRIFVRVAEAASFTKAAMQLALPRSTVSTAVLELESRVGMRLLNRTTRSVSLTVDGEAFLQRCVELLDDLEDTENLFRKGGPTAGRLRITTPTRIAHLLVAPALPRFFAAHPGITVDLTSTDSVRDLIEDDIDCAIRVGATDDDRLAVRSLGALPIINCASPAYLQKYGIPRRPADLARHLAINYIRSSTGRPELWTFLHKGELESMSMAAQVSTDDAETYIAAALAGLGLIQVPAYDVRALLTTKRLVEVLPHHRAPSMPISIAYPKRRHLSQRLRVFVDWVTDLLKKEIALTA
jgi:LysR family transcriptional regulator for bpeEF and oprC